MDAESKLKQAASGKAPYGATLSKQQQVDRAKQDIAKAVAEQTKVKAKGVTDFAPALEWKVGETGRLQHVGAFVFQIVDEDNMLIKMHYISSYTVTGPPKAEVVKPVTSSRTFWLKGVPTKGLVDGKAIDLPPFATVADTKMYKTKDGSATVYVIEPFALKE